MSKTTSEILGICNKVLQQKHDNLQESLNYELIQTIGNIINILKNSSSPVTLSTLSNHISSTGSKAPIWKIHQISLSNFIKKFPNNFNLNDKTTEITLVSEVIDNQHIMDSWNKVETDLEKLNTKYNMDLKLFKLPENINYQICDNHTDCDNWITEYIYEKNITVIGLDTETTILSTKSKPSILQLSTDLNNLIIQLYNFETLPLMLIKLLSDNNVTKIGVSIVDDLLDLGLFSTEFVCNSISDLSKLAKSMKVNEKNGLYGLRDLAAIFLGLFLDNKGLSDIKLSNWSNKELTRQQIEYALGDSYISIRIYESMKTYDNFQSSLQSSTETVYVSKKQLDDLQNKIEQKSANKKQIKEKEENNKKQEIDRIIKKWMKDEDDLSLKFEPMNSFYRNYVHQAAKKNGVKSESIGKDPNKYVILKK